MPSRVNTESIIDKGAKSVGVVSRMLIYRVGRVIRVTLTGVGLVVLIVTFTPLDFWWATRLAGPWNDPNGDVLVILGGSVLDDGTIGSSSYRRAVYGLRVWKESGFQTIVLVGGGADGNSVAESMKDFLVGEGIPSGCIRLELRSRSTRENALFAKPILDEIPGRKVLLTSDYHMFRAERAFKKAGIEILPRPLPDVRQRTQTFWGRWDAFLDLLLETVKIVDYYVRGWI